MANHPSAAKRNRQNVRRNARNSSLRSRMRRAIRTARSAIESEADDRTELVAQAVKIIQRTASKNVIHKNTASRYVSRIVQANRPS
ncbi:MAG: 30S ribosomal protein S20 [Myxococcales bacterium]|nr:30S ribosomal protein S20 [Myxococcales bacterium]